MITKSKRVEIMKWLEELPKNRQRGSFPRCLLLLSEDRPIVAGNLTNLIGLLGVRVETKHFWMPRGLPVLKANGAWDTTPTEEAKLGESAGFLPEEQRKEITNWWLAAPGRANTPNWDIASICTVGKKEGLLLAEAKAHKAELKSDGKTLGNNVSEESKRNHNQIARAISVASGALNEVMAGWKLSCDSHYQMANRFAWAWKLASMGVPVVLVYLGFLNATEMEDLGEPFTDYAHWSKIVLEHSKDVVPQQAWGRDINVGHATITPLIRVWQQDLQSRHKPKS